MSPHLTRVFHFARRNQDPYTPMPPPNGEISSAHVLPAPSPRRSASVRRGTDGSAWFQEHDPVTSPRWLRFLTRCPRSAVARYPPGTGSAQIRRSMSPNSRCLRRSLLVGHVRIHRAPLGSSVRLWTSAQDTAEQSRGPGRTAREGRYGESARGRAVGVGGFRNPEHLVRGAAQPHDSSRVGVLAPALAVPRP